MEVRDNVLLLVAKGLKARTPNYPYRKRPGALIVKRRAFSNSKLLTYPQYLVDSSSKLLPPLV